MATLHIITHARPAIHGFNERDKAHTVLELYGTPTHAAIKMFRTLADESDADRLELYTDEGRFHLFVRDPVSS